MKVSILDQFAADAIHSPAVVTGGGGCKVTKVKSKSVKCKSKSVKCKTKSKSKASHCPPPVCC
jgi:hypothetical protein